MNLPRICLYDRLPPEVDRWIPGDRYVRPIVRRLVRRPPPPSGLDKFRINLALGLARLGISHIINPSFRSVRREDWVCVLGRGRQCLRDYDLPNPIVGGVGMMTHPTEWPGLFTEYPVALYLQQCQWTRDLYARYFPDRVGIWAVGIDTDAWRPPADGAKTVDVLIYDKVRWEQERYARELIAPVREALTSRGLSWEEIRYGYYRPEDFHAALQRCRAMVFLCESESQGLAYQEAMACGVPILAWDPGRWLDPGRMAWGTPDVPATSVPYFDERCGLRFKDSLEFPRQLEAFLERQCSGRFAPRDFVLDNLTLERCAGHMVSILREANG